MMVIARRLTVDRRPRRARSAARCSASCVLDVELSSFLHSFADNLKPYDFLHGVVKSSCSAARSRCRQLLLRRHRQGRRRRRRPRGQRAVVAAAVADHAARLPHHAWCYADGDVRRRCSRSASTSSARPFARRLRDALFRAPPTRVRFGRRAARRGRRSRCTRSATARCCSSASRSASSAWCWSTRPACRSTASPATCSQVGAEFIQLLVRDFGPSLTAMMLATRVGAGIAAEIGSMKVTEQVDALRMSGVEPIDYLIVPRFLASLVMTVVLTTIGVGVAIGHGRAHRLLLVRRQPGRLLRSVARAARRPGHRHRARRWPTAPRSRSSPASAGCARAAARRASAGPTTRAVIGASLRRSSCSTS